MQLAAQRDGDLHQMDVKIAYLHLLPTAKCTWSNSKDLKSSLRQVKSLSTSQTRHCTVINSREESGKKCCMSTSVKMVPHRTVFCVYTKGIEKCEDLGR